MRSMSAGSSMLAITVSFPPQRQQRSISIANIRFSLCIQITAVCLAPGRSGGSLAGSAGIGLWGPVINVI
jgi:hypothetical protein